MIFYPLLRTFAAVILVMLMIFPAEAQESLAYQSPDPVIQSLIDAPPTPRANLSPDGQWMLLASLPALPGIEEVAQDELRLAGLRIQPRTNGSSRSGHYNGFSLKQIETGKDFQISGLPKGGKFENLSWSPDGKFFAFTNTDPDNIGLWIVSMKFRIAKPITGIQINDAMRGNPYTWMGNSGKLIVKALVENRSDSPKETFIPNGPTIQSNDGEKAPVRTYQDLLKNQHDIDLFDYYTAARLVKVDAASSTVEPFLGEGIYSSLSSSPDGQLLMTTSLEKPYSYLVPYSRFPQSIDVYNQDGKLVKNIAKIALAENIPKGFGATRKGPRSFSWQGNKEAVISYVEALDGGDPKSEAEFRDQVFLWEAPFDSKPTAGPKTSLRYGGINWGKDDFAIIYEWWWTDRREVTSVWNPEDPGMEKKVLFDRSWEDSYNDPGNFRTKRNEFGRYVLHFDKGGKLFMTGQGASPEGNRPFLDKYDPATGESERLWRSEAPYYEAVSYLLDVENGKVLTRRESEEEPPNYFIRDLNK
ncbi:MAG: S9 family peptidase, partial [Saprospiraceae bacterium]|nr:S9 family peptidase [Saprospiraceae bacterium]